MEGKDLARYDSLLSDFCALLTAGPTAIIPCRLRCRMLLRRDKEQRRLVMKRTRNRVITLRHMSTYVLSIKVHQVVTKLRFANHY